MITNKIRMIFVICSITNAAIAFDLEKAHLPIAYSCNSKSAVELKLENGIAQAKVNNKNYYKYEILISKFNEDKDEIAGACRVAITANGRTRDIDKWRRDQQQNLCVSLRQIDAMAPISIMYYCEITNESILMCKDYNGDFFFDSIKMKYLINSPQWSLFMGNAVAMESGDCIERR